MEWGGGGGGGLYAIYFVAYALWILIAGRYLAECSKGFRQHPSDWSLPI